MSSRTRRRPARGPAGNPLIAGDTGNYGGPQGGAGDGGSLSGDLASREFGVPQADIPGGIGHLVNPQTIPAKTRAKPERPADYHKYHGVASDDSGYETPPDESGEDGPRPRPERVPVSAHDAVPVYNVSRPGDEKMIRKTFAYNVRVNASTGVPTRICDRDVRRSVLKVLNEDSTIDIRISSQEEELLTASAQGTGGAGAGALIWHGTNSYTDLEECQDAMYAICTSASTALLSLIIVTDVPLTEN